MPESQLQRACSCGGSCPKCSTEQDSQEQLQMTHIQTQDTSETTVPPIVREVISSPGQSLDSTAREFMESGFGHDFSRVRVHTDARAAESARAVNAQAYTVGRDVVFGAGQYAPGTHTGKSLLAHELAHVSQQSQADASVVARPAGGADYDALERDADVSAAHAVAPLWGRAKAMASGRARPVAPRLKSGLRLSRFSWFGAMLGCEGCGLGGCDETCEKASKDPILGRGFGGVICDHGLKCPCIFYNRDPGSNVDINVDVKRGECPDLDRIVMIHEERHLREGDCGPYDEIHRVGLLSQSKVDEIECLHRPESIKLLDEAINKLDESNPCKAKMATVREARERWIRENCGK
jgi:Domain of unknown function (DUF4157)